jgi:dolichol-phosphate mannosyltransferase
VAKDQHERCVYLGLPAFNEELAIAPLFDRVREAQKILIGSDNASGLKVLVYDDGSTDNTAEQVRTHSHDLDVYLLSPQENGGLGVALRGLFTQFLDQAQKQDVLVVMDTDDTHDPSQISELLRKLDQESLDVVIASRYRKGSKTMGVPAYRQMLSLGFAALVKVMLPIRGVLDYSCGYRVYTYEALSQISTESGFPLQESGFASMPEVLVRLRQKSLHFGEIPLRLSYDRRLTVSKMRAWENSRRLLSRIALWRFVPSSLEGEVKDSQQKRLEWQVEQVTRESYD